MNINLDLLKKILLVDRGSKNEYPMINFVWNYLHQVPNLTFEIDHYGNLFITKNTTNPEYYPCIIAHMDCVVTWKGNRTITQIDDVLYGEEVLTKDRCGLSADDGAGIYAALEILNLVPNLKICFTTEEEIGAVGAEQAAYNIDFFADVSYFLQADRRGKSDLIYHTNCIDVCSKEFLKKINKSMKKFDYAKECGTFTDVGVLVEEFKISGCNISCGYSKEHTVNESLNIKWLENCINFMLDIIENVPSNKQYEIEIKHDYYYGYYRDYYSRYDDNDFDYNDWGEYYSHYGKDITPVEPKGSEMEHMEYPKHPCDNCSTFDCMNCDKIPCY